MVMVMVAAPARTAVSAIVTIVVEIVKAAEAVQPPVIVVPVPFVPVRDSIGGSRGYCSGHGANWQEGGGGQSISQKRFVHGGYSSDEPPSFTPELGSGT